MKAALFSLVPYAGPASRTLWPVPVAGYSSQTAEQSMQMSLEQWELADQVGFDWVTVAEHHYSPMSLTPNPMVMAGAMTQRVKRAKVALLGAERADPQSHSRGRRVRHAGRDDRRAGRSPGCCAAPPTST